MDTKMNVMKENAVSSACWAGQGIITFCGTRGDKGRDRRHAACACVMGEGGGDDAASRIIACIYVGYHYLPLWPFPAIGLCTCQAKFARAKRVGHVVLAALGHLLVVSHLDTPSTRQESVMGLIAGGRLTGVPIHCDIFAAVFSCHEVPNLEVDKRMSV